MLLMDIALVVPSYSELKFAVYRIILALMLRNWNLESQPIL
jgi:hypothetical protein